MTGSAGGFPSCSGPNSHTSNPCGGFTQFRSTQPGPSDRLAVLASWLGERPEMVFHRASGPGLALCAGRIRKTLSLSLFSLQLPIMVLSAGAPSNRGRGRRHAILPLSLRHFCSAAVDAIRQGNGSCVDGLPFRGELVDDGGFLGAVEVFVCFADGASPRIPKETRGAQLLEAGMWPPTNRRKMAHR